MEEEQWRVQNCLQPMDSMTNRQGMNVVTRRGKADYTNTCFHNALIIKEEAVPENKSAHELAKEENFRHEVRIAQKEQLNMMNEVSAATRGDKALEREKMKTEMQDLEKELKELQKADGQNKISQHKDSPKRMPIKEKVEEIQKQKKMEDLFEKQFLADVVESSLSKEKL
jgi:hypothetical protein